MLSRIAALGMAVAVLLPAGPIEFGLAELERAVAGRPVSRAAQRQFAFKTEVSSDPAESYHVIPGLITGGDLRGIMYGLLDAAEQIRSTGRIKKSHGAPVLALRGLRWSVPRGTLGTAEIDWPDLFRAMARNRFNRFNVVLTSLSELVPDASTTPAEGDHAIARLRSISQAAADYGVDFALAVSAPGNADGDWLFGALQKVLAACPAMRTLQFDGGAEAANYAIRALASAGRRITLEGPAPALVGAAVSAGVPVRLFAAYPGEKPFARQFFWQLKELPSANLAASVNRLKESGAAGFELAIDLTPADALPAAVLPFGRIAYDGFENDRR